MFFISWGFIFFLIALLIFFIRRLLEFLKNNFSLIKSNSITNDSLIMKDCTEATKEIDHKSKLKADLENLENLLQLIEEELEKAGINNPRRKSSASNLKSILKDRIALLKAELISYVAETPAIQNKIDFIKYKNFHFRLLISRSYYSNKLLHFEDKQQLDLCLKHIFSLDKQLKKNYNRMSNEIYMENGVLSEDGINTLNQIEAKLKIIEKGYWDFQNLNNFQQYTYAKDILIKKIDSIDSSF